MIAFTDGQLTLVPGFVVLIPAALLAAWIWSRRDRAPGADRSHTWMELLAVAHVSAVIALTVFPIPIGGQEYYRVTRGMSEDNLVPFGTISWQLTHLRLNTAFQLVGNMVVLAPLGIYGPALWPALRDWRRFLVVAIAFGVAIELTQFAGSVMEGFTYRVTDVDDAIMNATGAMIGFFAWPWAVAEYRRRRVTEHAEARPAR
jgi:glycopeptide antibiotics resistance protein